MFGSYGINECIKNAFALSAPFLDVEESVKTMSDLKPSYIRFLRNMHFEFPIQSGRLFLRDRSDIETFSKAFSASKIDDLQQEQMVLASLNEDLFDTNVELVNAALEEIRCASPELRELFDLVIHSILLSPSGKNSEGRRAHGGSSNKCIGLIWLSFKPETSIRDVVEMLIHEMTHTLIFLDELNRPHFDYTNLNKEPNWALSSILKKHRPMDKVVHSVVVSMEILFARENYLSVAREAVKIHPDSNTLSQNIENSIESVMSHPNLKNICQPRAIALMRTAREQLKEFRRAQSLPAV